ncbi:MAG: class I SAM-dependent methyltransferase [Gammaproteobacteria bacterium]|nr:class I SAM-dependent methyltransferase [Gammaproteobacteria bacterium]
MDQSARFWDRIAERYSRQPIGDEAAYQKKLEITRKYLRSDMKVLEIGCGTGSTAIAHAPFVKHIQAIDISAKMLEIARGRASAVPVSNVTFERSRIDQFSAPAQSFDAVLGLSILHLLDNMEEVVAQVYRLLKPGGVFVTSTVCMGDTMKFLKVIAPIGRFLGLMPSVNVFTSKALLDGFAAAGFEIDYQWQPGEGNTMFIVAKKAR